MKTILTSLLTCMLLSFLSCSKSSTTDASGSRLDSITVRKLSDNTVNSTTKFWYDPQERLTGITYNSGEAYIINYNSAGQLQSAKYMVNGQEEIMTNVYITDASGKIVQKTGTPVLPNLQINDRSFTYDNSGRLIADTQHTLQTATVVSYETFEYNAADDVVAIRFYQVNSGVSVPSGGILFTYDDKVNPFYNIRIPYYMIIHDASLLSKHNVATRTPITGPNLYVPTTYTYYSNGLPKTIMYGNAGAANGDKWEFIYN